MVSVFPVIGQAGIAKHESDQLRETCLGAYIIRENQNTALTSLEAGHGVGGLTIMATFLEAMALRTVENDNAQACV